MRSTEFITEGLRHPVIVVDVQPAYGMFEDIINFVNDQTGRVLMFVNAEDQGLTADTVQEIQTHWNNIACGYQDEYDGYEEDEYGDYVVKECENAIDWSRFEIVDKGYGYLRGAMDQHVSEGNIVKTIREMYRQRVSDARMLFDEDLDQFVEFLGGPGSAGERHAIIMNDEGMSVEWTSISQLRSFSGAYIVGGGRDECLREVELLMNAFNIRYKRINSLVY